MYLRKSRADAEAEAHGEGETLARHEKALLELAKRQNLNVTEIYREIVSGETIAARPVMQRLLSEVEQEIWTGVLVMEVERLARGDTMDQGLVAQTFKFGATKIITPAKTYDPNNEFDEEYFEFGLFMSRREYKTINRRLQRGRAASAMEGKYVCGRTPYGYTRVKLEKEKGYTLAFDPERADVVKLMFSLYVDGTQADDGSRRRLGMGLIARHLNQMNIPPIRHQYWTAATVRDILINPVYAGKIRWNFRPRKKKTVGGEIKYERARNYDDNCIIADGRHPAIVSIEAFEAVQKSMAENPPPPVKRKLVIKNPFVGLVVCGKCGKNMFLCDGNLVCVTRECSTVATSYASFERRALSVLADWLREYELQWPTAPENNNLLELKKKAAKNIENEIAAFKTQLGGMHDLLERSVYTVEQFLDRSRSVSERTEEAKRKLKVLEKDIRIEIDREKNRLSAAPKIKQLLDVYETLPTAAKNDMLKELLEKIVYTKSVKGNRWRREDADKFEIVVYPKLPSSVEK
jgi:DNA invertase Pin-like site-specific DNA recombinase